MTTYYSMLICEEGEYILPLCDDLLNEVGWNLGDEIDIEISYDADTGKKGIFCMKKPVARKDIYIQETKCPDNKVVSNWKLKGCGEDVSKLSKDKNIREYKSRKRKTRQKKSK